MALRNGCPVNDYAPMLAARAASPALTVLNRLARRRHNYGAQLTEAGVSADSASNVPVKLDSSETSAVVLTHVAVGAAASATSDATHMDIRLELRSSL